jgi:glutathione S-transferase
MKLIIGNKAYSSWSLRGWLAAKHSGLPFEELALPMYDADWPTRRTAADLAPSGGKVPLLWDGEVAAWNGLGIIDHFDRKIGGTRYWPTDAAARSFAMSIAAEMQSSYQALRSQCSMNVRRHYPGWTVDADAAADIARIDALWCEARARFGAGGPYLFGEWGAADMMFAPVASRFTTYDVTLSEPAEAYRAAVMAHPHMVEWIDGAMQESWSLPQYEF